MTRCAALLCSIALLGATLSALGGTAAATEASAGATPSAETEPAAATEPPAVAEPSRTGTAAPPAKDVFSAVKAPAALPPAVIGAPARGCIAGAQPLAMDGPRWQVMRLSRNRYYGHPRLVAYIERLSEAAAEDGWPGLLVGDLAQPRGGPMRSGHASHQSGIDVDLWLTPAPDRKLSPEERETLGAASVLKPGTRSIDAGAWTEAHMRFIRRAASDQEVARVFVHPAIKKALCEAADRLGPSRAWLTRVRPWWGHDDHIHVRLKCPPGDGECRDQDPPPAGDGCGSQLAWWLSDEPWTPKKPTPPKPPLRVADLPPACQNVLSAPAAQASPATPSN